MDLRTYQCRVTLDVPRPGSPTDRAIVRHRSEDDGESLHRP